MSNTGFKGISASFDELGQAYRYQISVQWEGRIRKATIWCTFNPKAGLIEALAQREHFENDLRKLHTERRIVSRASGITIDQRRYVWGSPMVTAQVNPSPGQSLKTGFSIRKHGLAGARALALAWRRKHEIQHYGGVVNRV